MKKVRPTDLAKNRRFISMHDTNQNPSYGYWHIDELDISEYEKIPINQHSEYPPANNIELVDFETRISISGPKRLKKETINDFLSRGGEITHCQRT